MRVSLLIKSALFVLLWKFTLVLPAQSVTDATQCAVCGRPLGDKYYIAEDRVAGTKRAVCEDCLRLPNHCFACGLPIAKNMTTLPDGRHYCARDAAAALVTAAAIQKAVRESEARLRPLFADEMVFPEHDLNITAVDRVNIEALFARPGNDYRCPNVLGYYQTTTNRNTRVHDIYLLSGLDEGQTRAVYAHEMTHAWMADHVPVTRKLGRDAVEGFCELIAYLLARDVHDDRAMREIEANHYTRGQLDLYRQAEQMYNLHTIIEWVEYGTEPLLTAGDLDMVRRAQKPATQPARLWVNYENRKDAAAGGGDQRLRLKAIVGSGARRIALINSRTFAEGERGTVNLGRQEKEIRCLKIDVGTVEIETIADGGKLTLRLEDAP